MPVIARNPATRNLEANISVYRGLLPIRRIGTLCPSFSSARSWSGRTIIRACSITKGVLKA
jgi:hypothetical protein